MKQALVMLCTAILLAGCSTFKREPRPSYYLQPSEIAVAETKCRASGGLQGVGVVFESRIVYYEAVCGDGSRIRWKK